MSRDLPDTYAPPRPIPFADAVAEILATVRPLPPQTVPLEDALGRYLAAPVRAAVASPRFDQSAMDGWAVRVGDLREAAADNPVALRVAGVLPAGAPRRRALPPGTTIRVFTGSPLPTGTEAVVQQEVVAREGDAAVFRAAVAPGTYVRPVGEDYRRGDVLLPAGAAVTPPVVGLLAQQGRTAVTVGGRPACLVVTMGDELVAPGQRPARAEVVDANGPALAAALRAAGAGRVRHVRVPDDADALARTLAAGLRGADLVVTVGGASVGDHDHVPAVRARLGVGERFGRVAMRPGLPNWFGLSPAGVPVFGLPGNPVSALVSFAVLVRPALRRLQGASAAEAAGGPDAAAPRAALAAAAAAPGDRTTWLRAHLAPGADGPLAVPESGQGSHQLAGLARARVLARLEPAPDAPTPGDVVSLYPLEWFER